MSLLKSLSFIFLGMALGSFNPLGVVGFLVSSAVFIILFILYLKKEDEENETKETMQ